MIDLGLNLGLLVTVADKLDGILRRCDHSGSLGCYVESSIHAFDRTDDGLAIAETDVQGTRRRDSGDRVPLQSDLARILGLDDQSLGVAAENGAGDSIAVGERDLIRPKRTPTKQQRGCDKEFHSLSLAN